MVLKVLSTYEMNMRRISHDQVNQWKGEVMTYARFLMVGLASFYCFSAEAVEHANGTIQTSGSCAYNLNYSGNFPFNYSEFDNSSGQVTMYGISFQGPYNSPSTDWTVLEMFPNSFVRVISPLVSGSANGVNGTWSGSAPIGFASHNPNFTVTVNGCTIKIQGTSNDIGNAF